MTAKRRTGPVVVGLGDSVMAGTHCGCDGIVARYAARVPRSGRATIIPVNLGSNGATTSSLIEDLKRPAVLRRIHDSRVVMLIVGANDLLPQLKTWQESGCPRSCFAPAVAAMGTRLASILSTIGAARADRRTGEVMVIDYWNVFQDGDQTVNEQGQGIVDWGRRVSRLANRTICARSAAAHDRCVDIYRALLGPDGDPTDLLADDGDHPNAKGVEVIVATLLRATPKGTF